MKHKILLMLFACLLAGMTTNAADEHGHEGHNHAEEAAHDANLLEVGEHVAHVRLVRDEQKGTILLDILGPDAKTALSLEEAPRINLIASGKRVQIKTQSANETSTSFQAEDEALKGHLHGKIRLKIEGKSFMVDLPDAHH